MYNQEPASSMVQKLRKTTKGKGRHFLTAKEGAGMTEAGRKAYNKKTGVNFGPSITRNYRCCCSSTTCKK